MNKLNSACGREFLMGVVARVLTDEPDLFSCLSLPVDRPRRHLRLPGGPGVRCAAPANVEHNMEEEVERWDGLFA